MIDTRERYVRHKGGQKDIGYEIQHNGRICRFD